MKKPQDDQDKKEGILIIEDWLKELTEEVKESDFLVPKSQA